MANACNNIYLYVTVFLTVQISEQGELFENE